jgi:hypothetical protein
MKRLLNILLLLTALSFMSGCTHNNGDIGDWFGTWKLQSIDINGVADESYQANVFWKFQNDIISMAQANDELHTADTRYGTWTQHDDQLLLDFGHSDNSTAAGQGQYQPLPAVYLPSGQSTLTIVDLDSSKLTLRYVAANEIVYTYHFKKWG